MIGRMNFADELRGAVQYLEGNDAETGTGPGRGAAWTVVEQTISKIEALERVGTERDEALSLAHSRYIDLFGKDLGKRPLKEYFAIIFDELFRLQAQLGSTRTQLLQLAGEAARIAAKISP